MSRMRNLLLEATCGERSVNVICVVGMGGIGKTTLMQYVFNDPGVTKHFQFTKWVCVSNDFDVRRIAGEIEGREEVNRPPSLEAALGDLKELIQGKRFFLVLDDVWEEDRSKWGKLYAPLSYGAEGSKIVVTTRSQMVSQITNGTEIFLKDLSKDDLWLIFQKYAFEGHVQENIMQLISVGRQIVGKLKGSPLAAKIIGGLLNSNADVRYWMSIMESDALLAQSKGDEGSEILRVLKLSYDHLPGYLKNCFVYCSLFPKDHPFKKHELVQLWMAQQFMDNTIKNSNVESMEEQYFDDLVHKSFFEKHASHDDVHVMHDLIHELANSVSKDDCLRLMKDSDSKIVNSLTIRHISIVNPNLCHTNLLRDLFRNYKMRTLLFLGGSKLPLSHDHLKLLFMKLRRLRVLGLQSCLIEKLPKTIGKLKHLRYLNLSHNAIIKELPKSLCDLYNLQVLGLHKCNITKLPKSIGNLQHLRYLDLSNNGNIKMLPKSLCNLHNLQVLDLRDCLRFRALPENMSALINLRHLLTDESGIASSIRGLGKLTALHELALDCGRRRGGQPILKELKNMNVLRELEILNLEEVETKEEAEAARLQEKRHLEKLKMSWSMHEINPELEREVLECLRPASSIRELTIKNYRGIRSPSWMEDPSCVCHFDSLEILEIVDCMNWEILPPLGLLPCLKTLLIRKMNHMRRLPAGGDQYSMDGLLQGTFPSLEELEFRDMGEWKEWEGPPPLGQSSLFLPRLQKLLLYNCPKLMQLPPLPPSLKEFEIVKVGLTVLPPLPSSLQKLIIRYNSLDTDSLSAWLRSPTSLRSLTISECSNIMSLPSTGAPSHMTMSVQTLEISSLSGLKSLGGFIHSHNSLEELTIDDCPKLSDLTVSESSTASQCPAGGDVASMSIKRLTIRRSSPQQMKTWLLKCPCLEKTRIENCPQLMGFGGDHGGEVGAKLEAALLNLSITLRELSFDRCKNLRSLPPKLRNLSSLEYLSIHHSPEIRRLPVYGFPDSLRELEILWCHVELEKRCQEGIGSDWPLISHIPRRKISTMVDRGKHKEQFQEIEGSSHSYATEGVRGLPEITEIDQSKPDRSEEETVELLDLPQYITEKREVSPLEEMSQLPEITEVHKPEPVQQLRPEPFLYRTPSEKADYAFRKSLENVEASLERSSTEGSEEEILGLSDSPQNNGEKRVVSSPEEDEYVNPEELCVRLDDDSHEKQLCNVDGLVDVKSQRKLVSEIRDILRTNEARVVGISGVGGSGKTTLLKMIRDKLCSEPDSDFDAVIAVTSSRYSRHRKRLQKKIGEQIGLSLLESGPPFVENMQAKILHQALSDKKFVLILDGVSQTMDWEEIGIPVPNKMDDKGKIVFATDEVCEDMENVKIVKINKLNEHDSLKLFRKNVDENAPCEDVQLVKKIIEKCEGQPLAIILVGRALSNKKTVKERQEAVHEMERLAKEHQSGEQTVVHFSLKLSYDCLSNGMQRNCLLYCSLFPENYSISTEELVRYWFGEGLLCNDDIDTAYAIGLSIIKELKNAFLLEDGDDKENEVKMHDVVREFALELTSNADKSSHRFFVNAGAGLVHVFDYEKWKDATRVSLMLNEIESLPNKIPRCPTLSTLLLNRNSSLKELPKDLFKHMHALCVLDMSYTEVEELPRAIGLLLKLRFLSLSNTCIKSLPKEVGKLVQLRQLNLSSMSCLTHVPHKAISTLSKLQLLDLYNSGQWCIQESGNKKRGTARIKHLNLLQDLREVKLTLKSSDSLLELESRVCRALKALSLQQVEINSFTDILQNLSRLQMLQISELYEIKKINIENNELENLEVLLVEHLPKVTFTVADSSFQKLQRLNIAGCHGFRDLHWICKLPFLQHVVLRVCYGVTDITIAGHVDYKAAEDLYFPMLKTLILWDLPILQTISPISLTLPCLERLEVFHCPVLKKLPLMLEGATKLKRIHGHEEWWNDLVWDDQRVKSKFFGFFSDPRRQKEITDQSGLMGSRY